MNRDGPSDGVVDRQLAVYGEYMRELRVRSGLSIRELAARAGIDKNTVLRMEAGLPVRRVSRERVCGVYGVLNIEPDRLPRRVLGGAFAHSTIEETRWHRARLSDPEQPSEVTSGEEFQDERERRRQGGLGFANQFFARLDCDMPEGRMRAGVFEVYGPSGLSRQQSGEAFVYVLRGSLRFFVGGETFVLRAGEAATFDRTVLHQHEPGPGMGAEDLPAVMVYVQVD